MPKIIYQTITAEHPLIAEAIKARIIVFVLEQKVPIEEEIDHYDGTCQHIVALDGEEVIGTLRLVALEKAVKLGRLVVLQSHRGMGLGKELMQEAMEVSRQMGHSKMVLDAQTRVIPFYETLGFVAKGEEFMDAGIPHRKMWVDLI